jgi:hypothetical protein
MHVPTTTAARTNLRRHLHGWFEANGTIRSARRLTNSASPTDTGGVHSVGGTPRARGVPTATIMEEPDGDGSLRADPSHPTIAKEHGESSSSPSFFDEAEDGDNQVISFSKLCFSSSLLRTSVILVIVSAL